VKRLEIYPVGERQIVRIGTIKRLLYRYLEHRHRRRALRRGCAEDNIIVCLEGRRWCDATERALIGDITNGHRTRF
jgi:hypothetical protein